MVDKSEAVHWQEISNSLKIYPAFETLTDQYIMQFLGYMPIEQIRRRHMLFIRTVLAQWHAGIFNDESFINEVEIHVKNIRNDDMLLSGYALKSKFEEDDYKRYETVLPEFKDKARGRLADFTNTDPPLEYSLDAEILLRQLLSMDVYRPGHGCDPMDYRAATILYFQGNLFTEGLTVAESSLLYRLDVLRNFNVCPTDLTEIPIDVSPHVTSTLG